MRQIFLLQDAIVIKKYDVYYKIRRYNFLFVNFHINNLKVGHSPSKKIVLI